jgi:hypothetical protein
MTLRYEINLYWSEEDQAFIAEVPDYYAGMDRNCSRVRSKNS